MTADTQLPRYQVFLQETPGAPHQDVGSVHAADPEMALLNARDVFVRRPECSSLWVVQADYIYSKTAEELAEPQPPGEAEAPGTQEQYFVFYKLKPSSTQTYAGSLEAASPALALERARSLFSPIKPPFAWFIIPARAVHQSDPSEADSFFDPAKDKPFRLSTDFKTVTAMRNVKMAASGKVEEASNG